MAVVDWAKQSIHTSLDYHVKIMEAPSSIEIDGNYYMLYARNLDNNQLPYFTPYKDENVGMYTMDSENFSEAIYTVQPNSCFNLSDLPSEKDPQELYYFICKNECEV